MEVKPITLEGNFVRLVPMSLEHLDALCQAGLHENLWRFMPTPMHEREDMRKYIENALRLQDGGSALPFVTIEKTSGETVGSTRYLNIDHTHRRLEIGSTWIAPKWQRTGVNTGAKYLMLCHAFENLKCVRVEFKTDSMNTQSRKALTRIGAKEEGTLRNHMIMPDGRLRRSVYYSIIDSEWPEMKTRLEQKMAQPGVR